MQPVCAWHGTLLPWGRVAICFAQLHMKIVKIHVTLQFKRLPVRSDTSPYALKHVLPLAGALRPLRARSELLFFACSDVTSPSLFVFDWPETRPT